jgi:hypothetical protein
MKNLLNFKQMILLFILVSGSALFQGCAVNNSIETKPVTLPDIVQMSKDKVPSKQIINEIKKSHTAYTLKASEYAKLQQQGVADSVVNYMQKTHIDLIRRNQQMQNSYYWSPWYGGYWNGGLGWGWPYGYRGWRMGPTIINLDGDVHRSGHRAK